MPEITPCVAARDCFMRSNIIIISAAAASGDGCAITIDNEPPSANMDGASAR